MRLYEKCQDAAQGHPLVLARITYFCLYSAFSVFLPFFPVFFEERITQNSELVGTLMAFRPLLMLFAAPLWGGIADKLGRHRDVLILTLTLATLFRLCLSFTTTYRGAISLIIISELFGGSVNSLLDSIVLKFLGDERKGDYGKLRLWGAVGWGIFASLGGAVTQRLGMEAMFYMHPCLLVPGIICIWFLDPRNHAHYSRIVEENEKPSSAQNGVLEEEKYEDDQLEEEEELKENVFPKKTSMSESKEENDAQANDEEETVPLKNDLESQGTAHKPTFLEKLRTLVSAPTVLVFSAVVWTMGTMMGVISNFLFIWLKELGGGTFIMGLSLTFTCIAEVPFFFFSGKVINRLGHMGALLLALVCYGTRLLYYSFLVNPYWVLPAELLHGITFGIGWACCVSFSSEVAPEGLTATTQGLVASVHWGLGNAGGAMLGGILFDSVPHRSAFRYCLTLAILGIAFVFLSWYRVKRS